MEMTYDRLNTGEVRGTTQADYLVGLDADVRVVAGNETVYEEPNFPVVELARSLLIWLESPDSINEVVIRGAVVNGVPRIGTAFTP